MSKTLWVMFENIGFIFTYFFICLHQVPLSTSHLGLGFCNECLLILLALTLKKFLGFLKTLVITEIEVANEEAGMSSTEWPFFSL